MFNNYRNIQARWDWQERKEALLKAFFIALFALMAWFGAYNAYLYLGLQRTGEMCSMDYKLGQLAGQHHYCNFITNYYADEIK